MSADDPRCDHPDCIAVRRAVNRLFKLGDEDPVLAESIREVGRIKVRPGTSPVLTALGGYMIVAHVLFGQLSKAAHGKVLDETAEREASNMDEELKKLLEGNDGVH